MTPGEDKSTKKHKMLKVVFNKYYNKSKPQRVIAFYLSDISWGYRRCGIPEPASISNTILDLCRKDNGKDSRVPKYISDLGYDLRKRTGKDAATGKKYAGEFVHVGVGNAIKSWLIWPDDMTEIVVSSKDVPKLVLRFIRPDEGGLFSIIEYTDALSKAIYGGKHKIIRIQTPMKWQPNEIDGLFGTEIDRKIILIPCEAKSLCTKDAINMDQLQGEYRTWKGVMSGEKNIHVQYIALRQIENGIDIAVFPMDKEPKKPKKWIHVKFSPPIINFQENPSKTKRDS